MNSRERVIKALSLEQPDRIPSFVESAMPEFKRKVDEIYGDEIDDYLLVGQDWTIYKFFGFSSVWLHSVPLRFKPLNLDLKSIKLKEPDMRIDRFGHISQGTAYLDGYLNTEEEWKRWIDAGYFDYEIDNGWVRFWEKGYREILKSDLVPVPVHVCWEIVRESFSFARLSYFMRKPEKRGFLKGLIDRIFSIMEEVFKAVMDAGFDVCTPADDTAYKNRVMIDPKLWEDLIVPGYTRINNIIHKRGGFSFWHSDGYTEPYFEGLIKAGFNGVQSLEPIAGMDLGVLKQKYGSRICLIGNIDCSQLLPFGTEQEVIESVKKCIKDAGQGGGYILGPATDLITSINPRNVMTMLKALEKYGKYPLQLD